MRKHLSFRLALALTIVAAALAFPLATFAGGATVTLDSRPADPTAGQAFTIGFTVRSMHDGSLQSDLAPTVTATNAATGEKITVEARSGGGAGHYAATVTLPSAGTWNWEIQPFGRYAENYPASVLAPLEVRAAGASVRAADPVPVAAPVPWPLATVALLCVAVIMFVAIRSARRAVVRA